MGVGVFGRKVASHRSGTKGQWESVGVGQVG